MVRGQRGGAERAIRAKTPVIGYLFEGLNVGRFPLVDMGSEWWSKRRRTAEEVGNVDGFNSLMLFESLQLVLLRPHT